MTQEDLKQLESYKLKLDDEAQAGKFNFFDLSLELLTNGMKKTQGYYRELLAQPFDLTVNETIELDDENAMRPKMIKN